MPTLIHPSAEISKKAQIGEGTRIWHHSQIREGAKIGRNCIISKGVYVDADVVIGDNVKIQNYVSLYKGVTLEDGVFVGPYVCFTNDKYPRAINTDASLKDGSNWHVLPTLIRTGASLGANATILCGITIGTWAMIGAGSVVAADIPNYALVTGNPAHIHGFVCRCGHRLVVKQVAGDIVTGQCTECMRERDIPKQIWRQID